MTDKWIVGEPGGPAGPFWSIVTSSGRAVVLQIPTEEDARALAAFGNATEGDFDTVRQAAWRLLEIFERDFTSPLMYPVTEGSFDYVVRAVAEALDTVKLKA